MSQSAAPLQLAAVQAPPAPTRSAKQGPNVVAPTLSHDLSRLSVSPPVLLQAELTIGAVDDPLEREADQVADQVMRMPDPAASHSLHANPPSSGILQRACTQCAEEDQLQAKSLETSSGRQSSTLQRAEMSDDEDEALQASPSGVGMAPGVAQASNGLVATGAVSAQVAAARRGGMPLSGPDLDFFQPRLAHDLSAVRVHSGPAAELATASVGARAFTVGPDIVVGAGQAGFGTDAGRRLLAHELAHVVQQGHAQPLPTEEEN